MKLLFVLVLAEVLSKRLGGTLSAFLYIQPNGQVYGAGENWFGNLGIGAPLETATPTKMLEVSRAADISTGEWHTCVLDGQVKCTGGNTENQLGRASKGSRVPLPVLGLPSSVAELACGQANCFALFPNGSVWAWGQDHYGQLGLGNGTGVGQVLTSQAIRQVSSGYAHACLLTTHGQILCMGVNKYGELGTGDRQRRSVATLVKTSLTFASVACGFQHTCAVDKDNGGVWCWGSDSYGQVGAGAVLGSRFLLPNLVVGLESGAKSVWASIYNSFVLMNSTQVMAFGLDEYGTLGDGSTDKKAFPVAFAQGLQGISEVRGGRVTTCVSLNEVNEVRCLGRDLFGSIGAADESFPLIPMRFPKGITAFPTTKPTKTPTNRPTKKLTSAPTKRPTKTPTSKPTIKPTKTPTNKPTKTPTNNKPT